jgi:hypothetical protein
MLDTLQIMSKYPKNPTPADGLPANFPSTDRRWEFENLEEALAYRLDGVAHLAKRVSRKSDLGTLDKLKIWRTR